MITRRFLSTAAAAAYSAQSFRAEWAENAPGVTDTEIKIGQTVPYSGPASAYPVIGCTEIAYFKMINDQGGINGRKINFISLDDAYAPSNIEQPRHLNEQQGIGLIFGSLGGYTNLAVRQYLNDHKIPQISSGDAVGHGRGQV
jgi:branched-chain amino acid transport system substrate-binding protein